MDFMVTTSFYGYAKAEPINTICDHKFDDLPPAAEPKNEICDHQFDDLHPHPSFPKMTIFIQLSPLNATFFFYYFS